MKVKNAIKLLQALEEDDNIIIAWWDQDSFDEIQDEDEMADMAEHIESKMDWSGTHQDIIETYEARTQ